MKFEQRTNLVGGAVGFGVVGGGGEVGGGVVLLFFNLLRLFFTSVP